MYVKYVPNCQDSDECCFERKEEIGAIPHRFEQPLDCGPGCCE